MAPVVGFPSSDGSPIYVSVGQDDVGVRRVARKPGELAGEAAETLETALARIRPAVESMVETVRSLETSPKQITVTLGVELSVEFGAVIAKGQGGANMVVTLTWER